MSPVRLTVARVVGSAPARVWAVRLGLPVAIFVIEFIIGSTTGGVPLELFLMLRALPLLVAAVLYWKIGRSRISGVLLAITALGTALGLTHFLDGSLLVLVAVVVPFFQKVQDTPAPELPVGQAL